MSDDGAAVTIAWMFNEDTSGWFTYSLAALLRHDGQGPQHIIRPEGGFITLSTGPRMAEARNMVIDQYARDHPSSDWLLFLDSDMTFDPDLVEAMLQVADPKKVPVLGALCFAGGRGNSPWPTIWQEVDRGHREDRSWAVERVYDYPKDSLCEVAGTGAACIMIHRNVLAAMTRPFPKGWGTLADGVTTNPQVWFAEGLTDSKGNPLGEDTAFCRKVRLMGIPVHVHTGIKTGHMKSFEITEEKYLNIQVAEAAAKAEENMNRAQRRAAARKRGG